MNFLWAREIQIERAGLHSVEIGNFMTGAHLPVCSEVR